MDNVFNPRFTENRVTFFKWPFLVSAFDNRSVYNIKSLLDGGISLDNRLRQLRYVVLYDHLDLGMYLSYAHRREKIRRKGLMLKKYQENGRFCYREKYVMQKSQCKSTVICPQNNQDSSLKEGQS